MAISKNGFNDFHR